MSVLSTAQIVSTVPWHVQFKQSRWLQRILIGGEGSTLRSSSFLTGSFKASFPGAPMKT